MVNALKKNLSPLPWSEYGKSTMCLTRPRHHANQGKSGLEPERARALGALCNVRLKRKLVAEKRRETHILSSEGNEKWIKDYVEGATAVARKRVEDAQIAIRKEPKDMISADNVGMTTREPKSLFEAMMIAIGDSLSDVPSSDHQDDGDDEDDEDTELCKLSQDDEHSWVVGTISKTVQQRMERFQQMQMKFDELTQPWWGDAADYCPNRDKKYWTTKLTVLAVVILQTDKVVAVPAPTTGGEPIESLDIIHGKLPMLQGTFRPGSSHMCL